MDHLHTRYTNPLAEALRSARCYRVWYFLSYGELFLCREHPGGVKCSCLSPLRPFITSGTIRIAAVSFFLSECVFRYTYVSFNGGCADPVASTKLKSRHGETLTIMGHWLHDLPPRPYQHSQWQISRLRSRRRLLVLANWYVLHRYFFNHTPSKYP